MSGIFACTRPGRSSRLESAFARLAYLGGDASARCTRDDTLMAVTRKRWELDLDFSGPILLHESPDLIVAADATLYDVPLLLRSLSVAGVQCAGSTPSDLIASAYRAWDTALVDRLTGDFAFVLWDRKRRRLVAARDPIGSRPLYFSTRGGDITVSSSSRAIAELFGVASELNLTCLGTQVAGLGWSLGSDTAFVGVEPLLAGHRLIAEAGRARIERYWSPAQPRISPVTKAEDAAEELRACLSTAVAKRLGRGTTAVWMSGGWDSTAVFAAGQHALAATGGSSLRPVSISYPVGDPGREDEWIQQVAERWSARVHWLSSDDIPLLDGLERRAARSDEPPAHLYELWNGALARGTRAIGARVALDGSGGDQLFQVSDVVLADLLWRGRLIEFAKLAHSRRAQGWGYLSHFGLLPLVPERLLHAAERISGRRLPRHYLERPTTSWIRPDFAARHDVRERDLSVLRGAGRLAEREIMLYLTLPLWGWGGSYMRGALLQEGVEVRSPLLDPDVIRLALSRPMAERACPYETKTLLRRSMRGLLPAEVLAPRQYRTGMTLGFSRKRMKESYPALLFRLFAQPLRLADLGIVDPDALRSAAALCSNGGGDEYLRVNLFHTMKIEFWLRGLEDHPVRPSARADACGFQAAVPAA